MKVKRLLISLLCLGILSSAQLAEAVPMEDQIRSGQVSTADKIVPDHPRMWMRGEWDWDPNNVGSFAWRILHGETQDWPWGESSANDQAKFEFEYSAGENDGSSYGEDNMYRNYDHDFAYRVLEPIIAGKAQKLGWGQGYAGDYNLDHTADEYFTDAREKLINLVEMAPQYETTYIVCLYGSTAYDWLVDETFTNGNPVLSEANKVHIRERLIVHADQLKSQAPELGPFFDATNTDNFYYAMVGLALYEPSRTNDPGYAGINAKAKDYLDDFDTYVVGRLLPALNEQGGDGGWHGGLSRISGPYLVGGMYESDDNVVILMLAPVLLAHATATGQPLEESLFNTGMLKYFVEFQAHMIRPTQLDQFYEATYLEVGGATDEWNRMAWILPMRAYSRRRFSPDVEQQRLGELGAWIRTSFGKGFTDYGSWDTIDQLLFEDKWVNPRSPEEIGFSTTRRFDKLGWVFMREGFTSPDDLAALFISQRYHWSRLDPYAQNSFTLERKGQLIEGFQNTVHIDGGTQRTISNFPTIAQGVETYAPGSIYDVGPGILAFESNDTYDYMLGDASHAYDPAKLSQFTRQLVYLKPDIFIVFDKVVTANPNIEKKWVVDPAAAPQDQGNNLLTVTNGNGMLWMKRLLPVSASVSLSGSEIGVMPRQAGTETIFLHVMQAVDAGVGAAGVTADDATVTQDGDWFHVQVGSHQVSFSREGGFEFDGQGAAAREDLNQDGLVDEADVQLCAQVILGFESDPILVGRADVNGDGSVNAVDLQQIVNVALAE
ncbi:MAG: hypothetical protein A2Z14_17985 [Chloroflexi bacterium RBG_16_48_8]|nr:MAG: hypothetical protein A2Z14_17985 [Chloroflexi bacterium RBG_16_48_8]